MFVSLPNSPQTNFNTRSQGKRKKSTTRTRWTLPLCSVLLISLLVGCNSEPTEREPTASEMQEALQGLEDRLNDNLTNMWQDCNSGASSRDPFAAINCLSILSLDLSSGEKPVEFVNFDKIGSCAQLSPGDYECKYRMGFTMSSPFMRGMLGDLFAGGEFLEGRFVLDEEEWLFIPPGEY